MRDEGSGKREANNGRWPLAESCQPQAASGEYRMSLKASIAFALFLVSPTSSRAQSTDWSFGPFEKPAAVNPIISPSASSVFLSPMGDSTVHWEQLATFNPAA